MKKWNPKSWQKKIALHQPVYKDTSELNKTLEKMSKFVKNGRIYSD